MSKLKIVVSALSIVCVLLFGESNYIGFAADQILSGKIDNDYVWEIAEDSIIITNCHNNITITIKENVCYVDTSDMSNIIQEFAVSDEEMANWSEKECELFENIFSSSDNIRLYYSDNIITVNDSVIACDKISSVNFGNEVKYVGDYAFAYSSIENVEFPNSLEEIGTYAFGECKALSTVNLGENVNEIGKMAFFDCDNLKSVVIHSKTANIQEFAFGYYRNSSEKMKMNDFVISGYIGSTAETYANENGFTFIVLDDDSDMMTTTTTLTTTDTTIMTTTDSTESTITTTKSTTTTTTNDGGIETTTTTATATNDGGIETTTTTATPATIASDEEFCDWAAKDYAEKTGITPENAEIEYIADGNAVITLTDADGSVLDVYNIDPFTGIGTEADGGDVNLPQTGYSTFYKVIVWFAILMTITGVAIVAYSRKESE